MPNLERADLAALSDLCTPWCLHLVVTLRIAEEIAAGHSDIGGIAASAGCDADMLQLVLRHLVGKGVFLEPEPGRFALNDVARELLEPSRRIGLDLNGIGGRFAYAWGTLPTLVKTGATGYAEQFGRPFWEDLDAHPEIAESFDALMGPVGHGTPDPEILINGDWESARSVVDVGGGIGTLLAEILRAHPHLQGTLVDLPRAVVRSAAIFEAADVAERAKVVGQSFFDPLPAGADLYILCKVLGNWPDAEAIAILRRCAEAARPSGRVVILGGVSPDDVNGSLSIETVLLGSKGRSLIQFRELAGQAGLVINAAGSLPSGRFVVECRRA